MTTAGHGQVGARVVVLGGGVGGVTAARRLRERLRPQDTVVLIEKEDNLTFAGTTLWILEGQRTPAQLQRSNEGLRSLGIDVRRADVRAIDTDRRTVTTTAGDVSYDYLVVALGAELHMKSVPGLDTAAYNLYTPEDAVPLRQALKSFQGGRIVLAVASLPFKCPAAPYEAALLIDSILRKRGVRGRATLDLYTPEPMPIGAAGKQAADFLTQYLADRAIALHVERNLASADPAKKEVTFKENGEAVGYDLLAVVPPHTAAAPLKGSAIAGGPAGWVPVDHDTLATKAERVYAIGDAAAVTLPSGRPLPKAAVFARAAAEVVANNIAVQVTGQGQSTTFEAIGGCQFEVGDGTAFAVEGNFSTAPMPQVQLKGPSKQHHDEKEALEQSALALVG